MATKDERGNYKGLVGNTVSYTRNGKEHLRLRAKGRKDKSKLVFDSRNDFKIIMKLIKKFKPLINNGFKDHKENRSAYHSALSVNRLNYNYAKKESGVENLDWFQFSEGNLSGAAEVVARKTEDGKKVEIIWQGTMQGLTSHKDDRVISCLYSGESNIMLPGPDNVTRDSGRLIIDPGKTSLTGKIEVFIGFTVDPRNYKKGSDRNVSKSKWVEVTV